MSNVLYPLSLIAKLKSVKADRTLQDAFEDGSTSVRRLWSSQYYKRKFELTHAPLTPAEFRYLRSFYSARGQYDSFWFRDNVNRDGNASVRFIAPFAPEYVGRGRPMLIHFDEVAPMRALPEQEDVLAAAGSNAILFWDANRELYYSHLGTNYTPESTQTWDTYEAFRGSWTAGALILGQTTNQCQAYQFDGTNYAKSANLSAINGVTAATIFIHAKIVAGVATQRPFFVGVNSAGAGIGLEISAANFWSGYAGGATGISTSFSNALADWRSVAMTVSGTTLKIYWGGVLIGTDTLGTTLSLQTGPAQMGSLSGSNLVTSGSLIGNTLVFTSALSGAQIGALHNLFSYQQGLVPV